MAKQSTGNKVYLKHFLDASDSWTLPSELKRNLALIQDLDERTKDICKQISDCETKFLTEICQKATADEKQTYLVNIDQLYVKVLDYANDKVELARQTYEMVDRRVRNLDNLCIKSAAKNMDNIKSESSTDEDHVVDEEVVINTSRKRGRQPNAATNRKLDTARKRKSEANSEAAATAQQDEKRKKKNPTASSYLGGAHLNDFKRDSTAAGIGGAAPQAELHINMPVNPFEPTYCICHNVSYGEMVGCDNTECTIEWFHFACVGLKSKPDGEWFCPRCTDKKS